MSGLGSIYGGAMRGLTLRGRVFLGAGIATTVVGIVIGGRDVLRLGVLLAALPLVSAWVVARTRYRLACTRHLDPPRVPAGQPATVVLRLDNVSRLATGLLLVEDRVPYVLGSRPRFVLDRVEPRGHRAVSYVVRSDVRGRFPLGPLSIRLTDPFGMAELARSFSATDSLTVTPHIEPLPSAKLDGDWSGGGESRSRSLAAAGEDDVGTREYRYGDALHRVHWRSTARHGELMVRREEQPWQSRATLLLDTRGRVHRGEGPGSSFEYAVSATASIAVHLARQGYALRFLTDAGVDISGAGHSTDGSSADVEGALLDALAVVQPSSNTSLHHLGALRRSAGESMLVAVLGALDVAEAHQLSRTRPPNGTGVVVLLDAPTWTRAPHRVREEALAAHDRVAALFAGTGWRVVRVNSGTSLSQQWPHAVRGGADVSQPAAPVPGGRS
ncbi:MAG: DUF58 domain-containing protein [Actinomycetota bacterium]|nr:DUF58 domain-containing protein [Actinomycetota bacterium]